MPTLREYSQKRALLEQLQQEMDSFEQDPNFKSSLEFLNDLKALQEKHGKSNQDVIDIVNPPATARTSVRATSSGQTPGVVRPFAVKLYRNPYTGEEVESKNLLNKRLQEWSAEYGKDVVREWVVQDDINR